MSRMGTDKSVAYRTPVRPHERGARPLDALRNGDAAAKRRGVVAPGSSAGLGHKIVVSQNNYKRWNDRKRPTAQIKVPAPSKIKTILRLLPRDSRGKPAAAKAKPRTGTPAGFANANAPMPNTRARTPKRMLTVCYGQLPSSTTGAAPCRACLA